MKNYIGFVNDHSGSMCGIRNAAIRDYNENINSVVEAANSERMDTVVSVVGFGFGQHGYRSNTDSVKRQVVVSNPHVLRPINSWACEATTPLYDGIGEMIELFESLPDADSPDVSFLVMVTTDGGENASRKYSQSKLQRKIRELNRDGRWTIVCRVPTGKRSYLDGLDIPFENIQEWDTTAKGMEASTRVNKQAVDTYFKARSSGKKSSNVFYSDASAVDTSSLVDISKEVSLYVVPQEDMGMEIRDFILRHRMEYLKGAAFYQLTKTEARIGHKKLIAIRERKTGKIFSGEAARQMIGLPTDRNARLHPGEHGEYDIFIQSSSVNRHLVGGTGVLYWPSKGVSFTQEELDRFSGKKAPKAAPAIIELPEVHGRTSPTKSPVPKKSKQNTRNMVNGRPVITFQTRELCREFAKQNNKRPKDIKDFPNSDLDLRWFVFA